MNNSWKEKNFEEKMTLHIDKIYNELFKTKLKNIIRNANSPTNENLFMDKSLGIDTQLIFKDNSKITVQEKTRKIYYFEKYNDFTFEYYNDPKTKEPGEWFKLASQLYFYGFSNVDETGYIKFYILDILKLRMALLYKVGITKLLKDHLQQNKGSCRASFFSIPFSLLRTFPGVISHESNKEKEKIIFQSLPVFTVKRKKLDIFKQQNLFYEQTSLFSGAI